MQDENSFFLIQRAETEGGYPLSSLRGDQFFCTHSRWRNADQVQPHEVQPFNNLENAQTRREQLIEQAEDAGEEMAIALVSADSTEAALEGDFTLIDLAEASPDSSMAMGL